MISDRERRGILAGRTTRLTRPLDETLELGVGQRIELGADAAIRIARIRRERDCHALYFTLEDHRPRLLHRNSAHGYTHSPAEALNEEPEAVPPHFQDRISREAQASNAITKERQRIRETTLRLESELHKRTGRARRARLRHLRAAGRRLDALESPA